ncbi:hypothetical protein D6T64_06000 [Cryobacterium melibiosiphilum]|uniref:Uncharacterized protein n=1 Tax=Cryobacterium melibiosiphilum TaxID=995039 RepID=A0A3A5MP92_9MICO|nr:hypothetical protein [Cryobacterium melibiosiphilum]RJT89639.1 hypothetical protein D6T64_06000 [Cryobacterium melibiosiphilum]
MVEKRQAPDRRAREQLSDYFYLVLAAMSLLQAVGSIEENGLWPGALIGLVTVMFAGLITVGNRGRFLPMFDNRHQP